MKDLPIIFPISLAVLLVAVFFLGAYAISEGATSPEPLIRTASEGAFDHLNPPAQGSVEYDWFTDAAIWVCPLH